VTSLDQEQAFNQIQTIFSGNLNEDEVVKWLLDLRERGETLDELVGFAKAMRQAMTPLLHKVNPVIDVCGTGGSGKPRFNVSTAAAFILASLGVSVAKHGNKGSVEPNGSFDLLEALDVIFDLTADQSAELLQSQHLCFLFARQYHPAVGKVTAARKRVGGRTLFNLLGPLCNPAQVTHQLLGASSLNTAKTLAQVVQKLGTTETWVVVSDDGRDELSCEVGNTLLKVSSSGIEAHRFEPQNTAFYAKIDTTNNQTATHNAKMFNELLENPKTHPAISKWVCLNAGTALALLNKAPSIEVGAQMAMQALEDKKVLRFFNDFKAEALFLKQQV